MVDHHRKRVLNHFARVQSPKPSSDARLDEISRIANARRPAQSCDGSYPDFCIAPAYEVGDLDCANIAAGWFTVLPPDPHGFDADYDGYGCESN